MKFTRNDYDEYEGGLFERILDFFSGWRLTLLWFWRGQNRRFNQWVVRTFMRELHDAHQRLHEDRDELATRWKSCMAASSDFKNLSQSQMFEAVSDRAGITEILVSLVAKDDAGDWTTVFDADTRLPDEYQAYLNKLVHAA